MKEISRRDFLKFSSASLGGFAFRPALLPHWQQKALTARIAVKSISVHSEPWDKSRILYQRYRDELVNLYFEVISDKGPDYNPRWFRVWGGYIHSAHLQVVQNRLNPVVTKIPDEGMLTEVTVPVAQSMWKVARQGWQPLYRLYYQSVHWVKDVIEGPDGDAWYVIQDELDRGLKYSVPATYLRPIPLEELAPIHPEVDPLSKRIEISINQQTLIAYEGDKIVMNTIVSTGLPRAELPPGEISTNTPSGKHHVQVKMPSKHMGNGHPTSDPEEYELPGVPWCSFFYPDTGVAIHGTYWHMNYGNRMSHGCVNTTPEQAKWLYNWTTPVIHPGKWDVRGYGTQVIVS
jgi:hypothetical protein